MALEEPWNRDLLITKEKLKLISGGKGYRQKDHETRTGGVTYENSVGDDLELFYDDIQGGDRPRSMAWTYFSPELTLNEMELVEKKDEEYMRSFKLFNNADVNETEMKESSSSSKYVSGYCRRKTIAIDSQNFDPKILETMYRTEGDPLLGQKKIVKNFQKIVKRKWWLFGIILVLIIGTALSIYVAKRRMSSSTVPWEKNQP